MKTILLRTLFLIVFPVLAGCGGKQSKTTDTDSAGFPTLAGKQAFLERYLTFRRHYEELEFDVTYMDGGDGMVPGPTEWDIRVFAKVPADELGEWSAGMAPTTPDDTSWVSSIPNAPTKLDAFQWHQDGRILVGSNPEDRIILYRNLAY